MKFSGTYLLAGLYIAAGIFHFINPTFYFPFIPRYIHYPYPIIYISGFIEFVLGLGVLIKNNNIRIVSLQLIIALLILFIPAHIQHIQESKQDGNNMQLTLAYIRLLIGHPLLIYWAYATLKKQKAIKNV